MNSYLLDLDFSVCFLSNDIEFVWSFIKSFLYQAMYMFVPKTHIRSHKDPPWFNPSIRHRVKMLKTLRRKYKTRQSSSISAKIVQLELELQHLISESKSLHSNPISFIPSS